MAIRHPSRNTINEARRLGMRMAASDAAIKPNVHGSDQYVNYPQFVQAHRHYIEVSEPFGKWEYLLERLAEHEEKSQHTWVNEPADWDSFLREVVDPIRSAFWSSWETAVGLQRQFNERVGPKSVASEILKKDDEAEHHGSGLIELGTVCHDLEVRASDLA